MLYLKFYGMIKLYIFYKILIEKLHLNTWEIDKDYDIILYTV